VGNPIQYPDGAYTRRMTRDEFNGRLGRDGGFRVIVRLLREDEGGRRTGLSGDTEYRVNWSIGAVGSSDPNGQAGAPMLIDDDSLGPGHECRASLVRIFPGTLTDIEVGTRLTAFEGSRPVAEAVVTDVLPASAH
jgi:hypothetical protein